MLGDKHLVGFPRRTRCLSKLTEQPQVSENTGKINLELLTLNISTLQIYMEKCVLKIFGQNSSNTEIKLPFGMD